MTFVHSKSAGNTVTVRKEMLNLRLTPCHYCERLTYGRLDPERASAHFERLRSVDHIVPKTRNGENSRENLVPCCNRCNQVKGDAPYELFVLFCKEAFKERNDQPARHLRHAFWKWIEAVVYRIS